MLTTDVAHRVGPLDRPDTAHVRRNGTLRPDNETVIGRNIVRLIPEHTDEVSALSLVTTAGRAPSCSAADGRADAW